MPPMRGGFRGSGASSCQDEGGGGYVVGVPGRKVVKTRRLYATSPAGAVVGGKKNTTEQEMGGYIVTAKGDLALCKRTPKMSTPRHHRYTPWSVWARRSRWLLKHRGAACASDFNPSFFSFFGSDLVTIRAGGKRKVTVALWFAEVPE